MWIGIGVKITNWWRSLAANGPFSNHATLADGLVSYWKLDELSGVRYDSVTASANDLTDNNTVGVSPVGPSGVVAQFTAANTEFLSHAHLADTSTMGLSFWYYSSDTTRAGLAEDGTISVQNGWAIETNVFGAGDVLWFIGGDYSIYAYTAPGVIIGGTTPAHVVVTYDGTQGTPDNRPKIYVNGVSQSLTVVGTPPATLQSGNTFRLGSGTGRYTNGTEGRVGLWNMTLASATILTLFNSGNGKSYADLTDDEKVGLVSYWNLDEVSGTRDDAHGANDLTDNNTVTSVVNAGGAMRNVAASFVAANSESLSLASWPSVGAAFTVHAWIKPSTGTAANSCLIASHTGANWFTEAQFSLRVENDTTLSGLVTNGSTFFQIQRTSLTMLDGWHQAVLTYDDAGDRKVRIYFDNDAGDASAAVTGTLYTTAAPLGVGGLSGLTFLLGFVDEVAVWSRILTAQERTDLWNSGAGLFY